MGRARVAALLALAACRAPEIRPAAVSTAAATTTETADVAFERGPWIDLFDGETLAGWRPTPFGGEGEVEVVDGALRVDFGSPLSGVTWDGGDFPARDYELELVAVRRAGNDFFCGLTFPVGEDHLTFVVGGWGGAVVGLSSLDGEDAARNETRTVHGFESGRAYRLRVQVAGARVRAWIDGEPVVDVDTTGRAVSLRPEVLESRPLGLACFATRVAWSDLRYRRIRVPDPPADADGLGLLSEAPPRRS